MVVRCAHNPKVAGSSPVPTTLKRPLKSSLFRLVQQSKAGGTEAKGKKQAGKSCSPTEKRPPQCETAFNLAKVIHSIISKEEPQVATPPFPSFQNDNFLRQYSLICSNLYNNRLGNLSSNKDLLLMEAFSGNDFTEK